MKIDVLTIFPKMFDSPFAEAMIHRAIEKGILNFKAHDLRTWAWNSYGAVDDKPYGGDIGMLLRVDVIDKALKELKFQKTNLKFPNLPSRQAGKSQITNHKLQNNAVDTGSNGIASGSPKANPRNDANTRIILTSARGKKFDQAKAEEWSKMENLIFICGRYEGVDQRVGDFLVDEEISIGSFVLTGGELPTMIMIDAVTRLLPGVLGKDESSKVESFSLPDRHIEAPQYTRPAEYNGWKVPEVLLSGDPKKIEEWKKSN